MKKRENFRQDSKFRRKNTIRVRPKHITDTLICSLHYVRMVKNNWIFVMTLGTYFLVRRFEIFKMLAYVKKR